MSCFRSCGSFSETHAFRASFVLERGCVEDQPQQLRRAERVSDELRCLEMRTLLRLTEPRSGSRLCEAQRLCIRRRSQEPQLTEAATAAAVFSVLSANDSPVIDCFRFSKRLMKARYD